MDNGNNLSSSASLANVPPSAKVRYNKNKAKLKVERLILQTIRLNVKRGLINYQLVQYVLLKYLMDFRICDKIKFCDEDKDLLLFYQLRVQCKAING